MPGPNFEALCMKTFLAYFASGIALPIHLLVAYGAHRILIKGRKIFGFLSSGGLRGPFELMLFGDFLPLLCILKLHKALEFGIEVGGWVWG